MWKSQVEEESVNVGLRRQDALCMECRCISYCCWVEVSLAMLTCWGYQQILNIGVSLSQ